MNFLVIALTFLLTSCAFQLGKIPIIVKTLEEDEIDYKKLMERKSNIQKTKELSKDCIQVFVFIPTGLTLELDTVLAKSCKKSNFSFDNKLYDEFYYFLYGKECIVNEHSCENS